jgi:hypothetical protein
VASVRHGGLGGESDDLVRHKEGNRMLAKLIPGLAATAGLTVAAVVLVGSPASAGPTTPYLFVGYAGGSMVRVNGNTVTSDLTAASNVNNSGLVKDTNSAVSTSVSSLLVSGAVQTSSESKAITGGYEIVSESKTADVSLLGGAIKATAIDTVSTSKVVHGVVSGSTNTKFVGLQIAGTRLPLNIPPNYSITLNGLASVIVNYQAEQHDADHVVTYGIGLYVGLLKPQGANPVGAAALVTPAYSAIGPLEVPDTGHFTLGKAYGTKVSVDVGTLVNVRSDPTAPISLAPAGTGGVTRTSSIASVNLTSLARVGAVTDSVNGTNTNSLWDAQVSSRVAGINLFSGAITASAVTAVAHARGTPSSNGTVLIGTSQLANLKIGGTPITLNTAPNTVLNLAIGKVTINQQIKSAGHTITVRALDIVLGKAGYGLPAGAEVQVAVATATAF